MSDWNNEIISEFREHEGKVGGMFEGAPLLLLHHNGAAHNSTFGRLFRLISTAHNAGYAWRHVHSGAKNR